MINTSNKKINLLLRLASKTALLLVLVATVFSPFGQMLTTPVAQAQQNLNVMGVPLPGTGAAINAAAYKAAGQTPPISCSADISTWDVCISNVVYVFTVGLGSGLAYVGSYFFDMTVRLSLDSASYALDFLSSGWTAARDLANMAFILILVYIAFIIMFQVETTGTIQMLAWVIFIALIINFSFFLSRVVVDAGNILAVQFYNGIQVPTLQQTAGTVVGGSVVSTASNWLGAGSDTKDLTANIMNALQFQTLFSTNSFQTFYQGNTGVSGWGSNLIILSFLYIAAGAMYFIIAASLLAAGIKFMVRIIVLWFAIIASPFALVAKAIPSPKIKQYYDMWQSILISHAFYPAVFLFIFFFINQIMATVGANNSLISSLFSNAQPTANATTGQAFIIMATNIANVGIRLGLVVALIYIGMKAADSVGVFGAQAAQKFTNWISRGGTGAVFGAAGLAGRYSLGLAGQRIAQNAALLGANAKGGAKGVAAGLLLRTGEGLSKRTFDVRGTPGVRAGLAAVGIDTNEAGGKGGYATAYANRVKKMTERAERFKQNKGAYERELKKIINRLGDDDKQNLAQAAKEAKDAQEDVDNFGSGDGRGNTLKAKTKQLKDLMKPYKDEAEKKAGKDFKDDYAKSLTTRGLHNVWGLTSSGVPGFISRADHEAASKVRDSKKEGAKLADLVGVKPTDAPGPGYTWDYTAKQWIPPAAPAPAAPATPAAPAAPAGGPAGGAPALAVLAGAAGGVAAAGGNQGQGGGQQGGQRAAPQRPTGRGPGTTGRANVNASTVVPTPPPPPQGIGVTSAGNRTQAARKGFGPVPPPLANTAASTIPAPTLSGAEKKLSEDIARAIGGQPENYTSQEFYEIAKEARKDLEEWLKTHPPSASSQNTQREIDTMERLLKEYREKNFRTPAGADTPGGGGRAPHRDSVWLRKVQSGLTDTANSTQQTRARGTGFTMPQTYTDRSAEIIDTYEWPDGTLHPEPPPVATDVPRLTYQPQTPPKAPLTPTPSAGGAADRSFSRPGPVPTPPPVPPAPNTAGVQPGLTRDAEVRRRGAMQNVEPIVPDLTPTPTPATPRHAEDSVNRVGIPPALTSQAAKERDAANKNLEPRVASFGRGWTPPEVKKGLSAEEKKDLRKIIKRELETQQVKTDKKIEGVKADIKHSLSGLEKGSYPPPLNKAAAEERGRRANSAERKDWLDSERKRMNDPIVNNTPLSTTEPPPAPPPPPPLPPTDEDKK
jgi:hypothetical protein